MTYKVVQGTPLNEGIANFYDESTPLWQNMWGDHLHHGYYGKGEAPKSNNQAQTRWRTDVCLRQISHPSEAPLTLQILWQRYAASTSHDLCSAPHPPTPLIVPKSRKSAAAYTNLELVIRAQAHFPFRSSCRSSNPLQQLHPTMIADLLNLVQYAAFPHGQSREHCARSSSITSWRCPKNARAVRLFWWRSPHRTAMLHVLQLLRTPVKQPPSIFSGRESLRHASSNCWGIGPPLCI